jgi:hypothetical protein
MEVNWLAAHIGAALLLFGMVRMALAVLLSVGAFYLLVKLAALADAMTKAKQTAHQSVGSQTQPAPSRG